MSPLSQSESVHSAYHSQESWATACHHLQQQGDAYCIATVVAEAGSLPRGTGAKMVITATGQFDTLGGGQMEYEIIRLAREGLQIRSHQHALSAVEIERFALAADLGQCCGGAAQVMLEYINTNTPKLVVFGAGHVTHALVKIVSELPCHLIVVDNRSEWLESLQAQGVQTECCDNPAEMVETLADNSHIVVITHEHSIDYAIVLNALKRHCFPFIGLIGSASKKERFIRRFKDDLHDESLISQLTCPVGNPDVPGKLPMQVAVSISAQLIKLFEVQDLKKSGNNDINAQQWEQTNQVRKDLIQTAR